MLEVAGLGSSPTKLLEALEKLGVSKGAELRAPGGPGGTPDSELVKAFEEALSSPENERVSGMVSSGAHDFGQVPSEGPGSNEIQDPVGMPVESTSGTEQVDFSAADDENAFEVQGALDPGPAERMSGEAVIRFERPEPAGGVSSEFLQTRGDMPDSGGMRRINPKETVSHIEAPVAGKDLPEFSNTGGDGLQEVVHLLERVTGGNASAVELYRLQYLVGMLKVQAASGSKISQQAEQGIQNLLKQQG